MEKTSIEHLGLENRNFNMIIAGKSNSGKSHFIRYLMRELSLLRPFDYGIVFTNTAFDGGFEYINNNSFIHEEFDEDILNNLIKIQKENKKRGVTKYAFVILDDCISGDEMKSKIIRKLFVSGRHYNISCILSTQYVYMIPPVTRSNANVSLFFDVGDDRRALESVYNSFGARFKSYSEFKEYYYNNIKDHKFILYHNENGYITFRCPENIPPFELKYNTKIN